MNISRILEGIRKSVANEGYSLLEHVSEYDMWTVANGLGSPVGEARDGETIKLLQPRASGLSVKNTLSSKYGTGSFPFHTDAAYWYRPPRFLLLRCINPGESGRCTLLLDSYTCFLADQWDLLTQAIFDVAGSRPFLATIGHVSPNKKFMLRLDRDCMKPSNRMASRALAMVSARIIETKATEISWQSGTLLVIDNFRLLHARAVSPLPDPQRLHQKVLIAEE